MKLKVEESFNLNNQQLKILKQLEKVKSMKLKRSISSTLDLSKKKLLKHDAIKNEFSITYSGLDALAFSELKKRGLKKVYRRIGNGKEAEIFLVNFNGKKCAMKINRVGSKSFKSFKKTRIELKDTKETSNLVEKNKLSWVECSRHNCRQEFKNLTLFKSEGFSVPTVLDYDRHILIMDLIDGMDLSEIKSNFFVEKKILGDSEEAQLEKLNETLYGFLSEAYKLGFVHGDFNEFNIMITSEKVIFLDFTQLIKVDQNEEFSKEILEKSMLNIDTFMKKKFNFSDKLKNSETELKKIFPEN